MRTCPLSVVASDALRVMGLTVAVLGLACEARDLSDALSSGHCDNRDRCAPGFECDIKTRECVREGTLGDTSGQGGSGGHAGSAGELHPAGGGLPSVEGTGGAHDPNDDATAGNAGLPVVSAGGQTAGAGDGGAGTAGVAGVAGTAGACDGTLCDGVCVDTASDPANCGGCGRACLPGRFSCSNGWCHCRNDPACNAGSKGQCVAGLCECSQDRCAAGEQCQSDGSCG